MNVITYQDSSFLDSVDLAMFHLIMWPDYAVYFANEYNTIQ